MTNSSLNRALEPEAVAAAVAKYPVATVPACDSWNFQANRCGVSEAAINAATKRKPTSLCESDVTQLAQLVRALNCRGVILHRRASKRPYASGGVRLINERTPDGKPYCCTTQWRGFRFDPGVGSVFVSDWQSGQMHRGSYSPTIMAATGQVTGCSERLAASGKLRPPQVQILHRSIISSSRAHRRAGLICQQAEVRRESGWPTCGAILDRPVV